MGVEFAVANVEGFVVDEETNQLAIRHVDHDFVADRVPVPRFGVGQRSTFVHAVQVRAGETVGIPLIEIASPPDMTVRQREE